MIVRVSRAQGRLAGTAAVAYAVLAGLENMDFLTVPGAHADPAEVVAYYATVPGILAYAGLLGLGAYLVFAAALWALLPTGARRRPAAILMLAGGFGGRCWRQPAWHCVAGCSLVPGLLISRRPPRCTAAL